MYVYECNLLSIYNDICMYMCSKLTIRYWLTSRYSSLGKIISPILSIVLVPCSSLCREGTLPELSPTDISIPTGVILA